MKKMRQEEPQRIRVWRKEHWEKLEDKNRPIGVWGQAMDSIKYCPWDKPDGTTYLTFMSVEGMKGERMTRDWVNGGSTGEA